MNFVLIRNMRKLEDTAIDVSITLCLVLAIMSVQKAQLQQTQLP